MGIPRFFRYLAERYPLINERIAPEMLPDFDNLYLDMNGIIHTSSHNNTGGLCVANEQEVFVAVFQYVLRLFHMIKPRKLFYMAIDGCAPRAKMNQQRSRRFRAANDAREGLERALEMGEAPSGAPFDSNCITPGTEFMEHLTTHLHFFIQKQIEEDPLWQNITVILSGPDVPGEGEHKIIDYIRSEKAQADYNPNLRHCMYGLDADLIMLSLATHEPHFALLREEVVFGKGNSLSLDKRLMFRPDSFQLLHISTLREYLEMEFSEQVSPSFTFELERFVDDFVLFCILVGNDFLPHLPLAEIGEGGLQDLVNTYKEHLKHAKTESPWLVKNCGEIDLEQLAALFKRYAVVEDDRLDAVVQDDGWRLGKRRTVGPGEIDADAKAMQTDCMEGFQDAQEARDGWYQVKFDMPSNTASGLQARNNVFKAYIEGLQWVMLYYFRGASAASWSWYYPYYHAPFAYDLSNWGDIARPLPEFVLGEPFHPFQQLMAVLPAASKQLLPKCYQWLFDSQASPIVHFYPVHFQIDQDGVKVPWGGVTLIPWIDPSALLSAMSRAEAKGPQLTSSETGRNACGTARSYTFKENANTAVKSPMPALFEDLSRCRADVTDFCHRNFPGTVVCFPNAVLPNCEIPAQGFPALQNGIKIHHSYGKGVKVFNAEAWGESLILHVEAAPKSDSRAWEKELAEILDAPICHVDYPFAHPGKVIAISTPQSRYIAGGKSQPTPWSQEEHRDWVWDMMNTWRQHGVVVEWAQAQARMGGKLPSGHEAYMIPIAEVQLAETCELDARGNWKVQLQDKTEYRLLPLVRASPHSFPQTAVHRRRAGMENWEMLSVRERFKSGARVICMDPKNACFGCVGIVVESEAASVRARFEQRGDVEDKTAMDLELRRICHVDRNRMTWYTLDDMVPLLGVDRKTLRTMLGTVKFRDGDDLPHEIGLNMLCELKDGQGGYTSHCLPSYSGRYNTEWWFSDLALEAAREYKQEFPGVFKAVKDKGDGRDKRSAWRDLQTHECFSEAVDPSRMAVKLIKYIKSCAFKQLKLVPENYMCLSPDGVKEVVQAVQNHAGAVRSPLVVEGSARLFHPDGPRHQIPKQLFAADASLGDRGVYIQSEGLVPAGTTATVIGVYSTPTASQLELLLDSCSFGGTDLCGRTPSMRGLLIPSTDFLRLPQQPGLPKEQARPKASSKKGIAHKQVNQLLQGDKPNGRAKIVVLQRNEADGGAAPTQADSTVAGHASTDGAADWGGIFKQLFQLESNQR